MSINQYGLSLHVFRSMVEQKQGESNENFIERQYKLLRNAGIDRDISNDYIVEIRDKCRLLGQKGWVICPYWMPKEPETWYGTWYWMVCNDSSDKITDYFIEDDYNLLNNAISYTMFYIFRRDWFKEARNLFYSKQYTGCAMLLTAIFEQSIRKCPIDDWCPPISKYADKAINKSIVGIYNDNSFDPFGMYIDTALLLPSIDGFVNMYFNSGARFESKDENKNKKQFNKDNEPPYLERNWLMHGLTQRKVTEIDCIKLFNVISSLHYVLHTLFQTDYRQ